jgi:hypothetical protein
MRLGMRVVSIGALSNGNAFGNSFLFGGLTIISGFSSVVVLMLYLLL